MSRLLDGKKIAAMVLADVASRVAGLRKQGIVPGLATVLVGDDPASHVYVGQKIKRCEAAGMASIHRQLPAQISQIDLRGVVAELNDDPAVHGIIVQMPLPANIDAEEIVGAINPKKDADGLHPHNQGVLGRLKSWKEIQAAGLPLPCTPAGVIEMLLREGVPVEGRQAVVVGRSTLVGKPLAQLLLSLNATVTIAHSKTAHLQELCRGADILVAALGRPHFLGPDSVKDGAVVIDVGISRTETGLKGDVDFDAVKEKAGWITPVPGGVGPMTVAMLMKNTVAAAERSVLARKT